MNNRYIRKATKSDLSRIAEILVFNNRLNFYPIFGDEAYSFGEMQVMSVVGGWLSDEEEVDKIFVYDDGIVRGFISIDGVEVKKLYVDTFFQSHGVGARLIEFAIKQCGVKFLWALEKNERGIAFYKRHGFKVTEEKIFEEGTTEYLVRLER